MERLRSELEERGWFNDGQKQQPPAFPERVGVVTSFRGDARYDIQNEIHEQDATVQGSEAPTSIANGMDVDAIIVGRGGGSDSNLQAFNTEQVAEAIFTANTPVVTAIGHTDDRLIANRVADVAAITPTAAGESIVKSCEEFLASVVEPQEQRLEAIYESFEQEHEHEQELTEAVEEVTTSEGVSPIYYKIAITVLVLLLLLITALWLGVI